MPIGISSSASKQIDQTATDKAVNQYGKGNLKLESGSLALSGKGATYQEAGTVNLGKGAVVKQNDFAGVKGNITITNNAEGAQAIAQDFISGTLALQQQSNAALQKALDAKTNSGNTVPTSGGTTGTTTTGTTADDTGTDDSYTIFGMAIPKKAAIGAALLIAGYAVWRIFFKK